MEISLFEYSEHYIWKITGYFILGSIVRFIAVILLVSLECGFQHFYVSCVVQLNYWWYKRMNFIDYFIGFHHCRHKFILYLALLNKWKIGRKRIGTYPRKAWRSLLSVNRQEKQMKTRTFSQRSDFHQLWYYWGDVCRCC